MTDHRDGWMTIREASLMLGVSELTVRRRIKDGRLPHRLEEGKYYVNPHTTHETPRESVVRLQPSQQITTSENEAPESVTTQSTSNLQLNQILPEYGRLAERAGRAAVLEERVRQLEEECSSLRDGVVALSNRNGWLEGKLEDRDTEIKLLSDSQRKISWWRRVFGGDRPSQRAE